MEFRDRHTTYEWQLQLALEMVEPVGEDRSDLREAWIAAQLIASNRTEKMTASQFDKLVMNLSRYLACKHPMEDDK